ncbi:MAG: Gfo/Idh/MocA family oxidoreductase [Planctomycetota bacterium]
MQESIDQLILARHNGTPAVPLRVAIAGLGRAGWNIHARALREMPRLFTIAAAMDPDAERREQAHAELGCRVTDDFDALIDSSDVDVVVVASPNHLHTDHAMAAIEAGKHVVAEKPFALNVEDAQRMVAAAEASGLTLAPFQNRRYEPHYRKVREIVDSGALGEVLQIRMCWHRFTRRWDWQAMRRFGGGALFNNGTHLLDQALPFLGDSDPDIFLDVRRGLSLGDADEHLKLVLRAEGRPTIDLEYSNASIFEHDRWHIMGTAGGLVGTTDELRWRTVDWAAMPERSVSEGPAEDRRYPSEDVVSEEHRWSSPLNTLDTYAMLYIDLFDAVRSGRPLLVTPESAVRYASVLDRCRAQYAEIG